MSDNALKTHVAWSLNAFGRRVANNHGWHEPKDLPCHVVKVAGQIVTVAVDVQNSPFTLPQLEVPILTSNYDWIPVQVGDKGWLSSSDAYLGGVTGLGGGTADLVRRGNLSTLVYTPVSNKAWQPRSGDASKREVVGPNGAYIADTSGKATITVDKNQGITLSFGGHSVVINSTGVVIDGKVFLQHEHTDVTRGSDDTGPVA